MMNERKTRSSYGTRQPYLVGALRSKLMGVTLSSENHVRYWKFCGTGLHSLQFGLSSREIDPLISRWGELIERDCMQYVVRMRFLLYLEDSINVFVDIFRLLDLFQIISQMGSPDQ